MKSNPRNLPGFAETVEEIEQLVAQAPWLEATDRILVETLAAEFHSYRFVAGVLAEMPDWKRIRQVSAMTLQTRRAKVIGELAARLGFAPQARYMVGLTAAQFHNEAARVEPVKSEQRAIEVARILAEARALPEPLPAEAVAEEPTAAAEVVQLRLAEETKG